MTVELDLSYYATKTDLKKDTGIDTLEFAGKTDFARLKLDIDKLGIDKSEKVPSGLNSLKSKVYKLDIDKLEATPVNLSKPSNAVKNDIVKKTKEVELVKKLIGIDTSRLVKKTDYDAKINEIKVKILSIIGLAITAALNGAKNKISNIIDLVKLPDYDAKIKDLENKCFTTSD